MTLKVLIGAIICATFVALVSATPTRGVVPGWILDGSSASSYVIGTDPAGGVNAGPAAYIKSTSEITDGFGTLAQMISASKYAGKRVQFSASVRTEDVKGWAGLWMRIDGGSGEILGFDNMQSRPIAGTMPWKNYTVVLDAPQSASKIAFGVLIASSGRVWMDSVKIKVVPDTVPLTGDATNYRVNKTEPSNLDFKQR